MNVEVAESFNWFIESFSSNSSLKESVEFLYHNFLSRLRTLKPPQFCTNRHPPSYKCVLYTLLPTELFSDDSGLIFEYFTKNVNHSNLYLWCSWLRDRTEYVPGFPTAQHEPHNESKRLKYITELVDTFWNKDVGPFIDSNDICRECWWILCESKWVSNAVIKKFISKSLFEFDSLHPALSSCDDKIFEELCDSLRLSNSMSDDEFFETAASIFVIFVSKFSCNPRCFALIAGIASRIIEWIQKAWDDEKANILTLVDTFNFIVCWSFGHLRSSENPAEFVADEKGMEAFQDMLHMQILSNFLKLPLEIQKVIVLNKPRQMFKVVQNPLFIDFVAQDNEPVGQFQIGASFNEPVDGNGYHTGFGFFDDVDNLFWG